VSVALAKAFGRIMIRAPLTYVPNATGVDIWLVLAVVVSLVACAWPARNAMRVPTAPRYGKSARRPFVDVNMPLLECPTPITVTSLCA